MAHQVAWRNPARPVSTSNVGERIITFHLLGRIRSIVAPGVLGAVAGDRDANVVLSGEFPRMFRYGPDSLPFQARVIRRLGPVELPGQLARWKPTIRLLRSPITGGDFRCTFSHADKKDIPTESVWTRRNCDLKKICSGSEEDHGAADVGPAFPDGWRMMGLSPGSAKLWRKIRDLLSHRAGFCVLIVERVGRMPVLPPVKPRPKNLRWGCRARIQRCGDV